MSSFPPGPEFCRLHLAAIAQNGFHAFPIPPAQKRTHWSGWTTWCRTPPGLDQIARWADKQGHYGIALACGHTCFAIDIDDEDKGKAGDLHALAAALLGDTPLVRIGRAPRRVLIYRVAGAPEASRRLAPKVELIGDRRYVLAHGIHPDLGRPYEWPDCGPETLPLKNLPVPDAGALAAFADAVAGYYDLPVSQSVAPQENVAVPLGPPAPRSISPRPPVARLDPRWVLDNSNLVCDGREAYLAAQVYRAYCECQNTHDAEAIAAAAWARFVATTDLGRHRRDGARPWRRADALAKVRALMQRPALPERSARRRSDGFWTGPVLAAFLHVVDARGAAGELSPATVTVSHAMTNLTRASGVCFASPATLATMLGLAVRTVKQARAALVAAGVWMVENNTGGRARGADYRPNPNALIAGAEGELARNVNGAHNAHPNLPVGGGATPQNETREGLSSKKRDLARALGSLSSRAASPKCRTRRRPNAATRVGDVPRAAVPLPPIPDGRLA